MFAPTNGTSIKKHSWNTFLFSFVTRKRIFPIPTNRRIHRKYREKKNWSYRIIELERMPSTHTLYMGLAIEKLWLNDSSTNYHAFVFQCIYFILLRSFFFNMRSLIEKKETTSFWIERLRMKERTRISALTI